MAESIQKEKAIRAIVRSGIDSYTIGFYGEIIPENFKEELSESVVAKKTLNTIQDELLRILALNIARMNEVAFNFEDFIMSKHLAQYFFANEDLGIGRDFWNKVCMSDRGYDTVKDEYCKNFI
ncbi:MAG: hypothetical protein ACI3X6_00040 [Alloprevotella sp.]